jgi:hypothetical protein
MKVMKRKLIGLFVCMLLVATIPLAAGVTEEKHEEPTDGILGWTIIRGWIMNLQKDGNTLKFRALRLHYTEFSGMETATGVLRGVRVKISDMGPDRQLTFGPLGSLTWIFGLCHGSIEEM